MVSSPSSPITIGSTQMGSSEKGLSLKEVYASKPTDQPLIIFSHHLRRKIQ